MLSNKAVNSVGLALVPKVKQLFKYEVFFDLNEDALILSDAWCCVVNKLQEDDAFTSLAHDWYADQLADDEKFSDDCFLDYMNFYGEEIAVEVGYTISKAKI